MDKELKDKIDAAQAAENAGLRATIARLTADLEAVKVARDMLGRKCEQSEAKLAELEAALTYYRDTFCEGFCGEDNWSDAGHAHPAIQRDCAGCRAAATLHRGVTVC